MFSQAIRAARGDSEAVEEASEAGVSAGAGAGAPNPNDDDDNKNKKEYKEKIKVKGKQKDNIPDRFKGEKPYKGESGKDAAKRILKKYGEYNPRHTGPKSAFNQLKKYFDTHFK